MNAPVPEFIVTTPAEESLSWQQLIDLQVDVRTALLEWRIRELEAAVSECPTCGASPCRTTEFCRTCSEADQRRPKDSPQVLRARRLLEDSVTLERAWRELNEQRPTPQTVIEAVLYCMRERGLEALQEPANVARLRSCDEAA